MSDLKQKIKNTVLFTPEEKVEILVGLDTFSERDVTELESIVDEYDVKYKQILSTFRQHMFEELENIQAKSSPESLDQMKQAIKKIKSGLTVVTSA